MRASDSWPLTAQTLLPSGATWRLCGPSTPVSVVMTLLVLASIALMLLPYSLATQTVPCTIPACVVAAAGAAGAVGAACPPQAARRVARPTISASPVMMVNILIRRMCTVSFVDRDIEGYSASSLHCHHSAGRDKCRSLPICLSAWRVLQM